MSFNSGYINSSINEHSNNTRYTDNSVDNRVDNSITNKTTNITFNQLKKDIDGLNEKRRKIFEWFSPLNFESQQINILDKQEPGTGQWFLKSPEFVDWQNGKTKFLVCQGGPGVGKSVLASIAIDHLETEFKHDKDVAVAYIYCNYKEKETQTPENLTFSLFCQLSTTMTKATGEAIHPELVALYDRHHENKPPTRPSMMESISTLKRMIPTFTRVFIIIDAVDEMGDDERDIFLTNVQKFAALKEIHLLVMSRPYIYIAGYFSSKSTARLDIQATEGDLELYIKRRIEARPKLSGIVRSNPGIGEEIKKAIIEKADGMFLLARFHLDAVEAARTEKSVRQVLQCLPAEINSTYDQVLERIEIQTRDDLALARRVLMWISYSLRPLTIHEIQHAMAIKEKPEDTDLDQSSLYFPESIMSVCAGLVILRNGDGIVELAHYTTQHYLKNSPQAANFFNCNYSPHANIAAACITYLSIPDIFEHYWFNEEQYGLIEYSAENWGEHAREANESPEALLDQILTFLKHEVIVTKAWIIAQTASRRNRDYLSCSLYPLQVASHFGLHKSAMVLLQAGEDPNLYSYRFWSDWSPQRCAVMGGHQDVVQLLLEGDAPFYVDHVELAAARGHKGVVQLLLEKDANVNDIKNPHSLERLLVAAARAGHESGVQLLLEKGADVNASVFNFRFLETPLYVAASFGHESVVQLLLKKGANVNGIYNPYIGMAPLLAAAYAGHESVVQLLLENGANVNGNNRMTPLSGAARAGHESVVQLLLEKGANVNGDGMDSLNTPLYEATCGGHAGVVRLLLGKGANPNPGFSPLYMTAEGSHDGFIHVQLPLEDVYRLRAALANAIQYDHETIVQLLLNKGAVACPIALSAAASKGRSDLVELFRVNGILVSGTLKNHVARVASEWLPSFRGSRILEHFVADSQAVEFTFNSVGLLGAAAGGHLGLVSMLFERNTIAPLLALVMAAGNGQEDIVRFLLEAGVRTRIHYQREAPSHNWVHFAKNDEIEGKAAIARTIGGEHTEVRCRRLWQASSYIMDEHFYCESELEEFSACYHMALCEASRGGYDAIVRLLFRDFDELAIAKWVGNGNEVLQDLNPLDIAAANGHEGIVQFLLDGGANVNGEGDKIPLCSAARGGHEDIVRLLLRRGADPNVGDPIDAASCQSITMLQLLLNNGAKLKPGNGNPLCDAVIGGHEDIVRLLLENGADVDARAAYPKSTDDNATPLCLAVIYSHFAIVRLLLRGGASATYDVLTLAVKRGNVAMMSVLLEEGVALQSSNESLLQAAVTRGHNLLMPLLLEEYAKALRQAVLTGQRRIAWLLFDNYAGALGSAVHGGEPRIVRLLLDKYPEALSQVVWTRGGDSIPESFLEVYAEAFNQAVVSGKTKIAQLLLNKGADINARIIGDSSKIQKVLRTAIAKKKKFLVKFLVEMVKDINTVGADGKTPLCIAIQESRESIETLLEKKEPRTSSVVESSGPGNTSVATEPRQDSPQPIKGTKVRSSATLEISHNTRSRKRRGRN